MSVLAWIWVLTFVNILTFYVTCEKISFKPTKQKLIATPIYAVLMFLILFVLFSRVY